MIFSRPADVQQYPRRFRCSYTPTFSGWVIYLKVFFSISWISCCPPGKVVVATVLVEASVVAGTTAVEASQTPCHLSVFFWPIGPTEKNSPGAVEALLRRNSITEHWPMSCWSSWIARLYASNNSQCRSIVCK